MDKSVFHRLSIPQRGIWFSQQLDPHTPFVIAQYIDIRGDIDVGLFTEACRAAGGDLGSGYLRLAERDGEPWQFVDTSLNDELEVMDLRAAANPLATAHNWMREEFTRPIDPTRDRLVEVALIRLDDNRWFWYTRFHHVALDGYGAANLLQRTVERYNSAWSDRPVSPMTTVPMTALLDEEDRYRASSRYTADGAFWQKALTDIAPPPTLTSRPGASAHPRVIGGVTTASVTVAARNTAPSIAAAFASYLGRMTGTGRVGFALPMSARITASQRRAGGMLANVVPLALDTGDATTVGQSVSEAANALVAALRRQKFPQEDIRREAAEQGRRIGSFGPSLNLMFFHEDVTLGDATGTVHILSTGPVEDFALNVYSAEGGRRLRVELAMNPVRYTVDEHRAHHARFLRFLDQFLGADPNTPIWALDLDETEMDKPAPRHGIRRRHKQTLPELFEAQVLRTPHAVAVVDGERELSYSEFAGSVRRFARHLVSLGVRADSVVAVMVSRSAEMVVACHSVVAAGGTYFAVDPDQPSARTTEQFARAGVTLALVGNGFGSGTLSVPVLEVDTVLSGNHDSERRSSEPITDAERVLPLHPDSAAYVVFTSGSTGHPKGITVSHDAIAHYLAELQHLEPLNGVDAMLLKTPASFDPMVREMWWPLTTGASLVIVEPGRHLEPKHLAELITRNKVTTAHFVPSILAEMLGVPEFVEAGLRRVLCGGEVLPEDLAARIADQLAADVHNVYGPAEAAVAVTQFRYTGDGVTLGSSLPGMRCHVLDARLRPLPRGAVGELYLSGPQLARAYLDAAHTAERFVADPSAAGARMYRTGDLVRRAQGGELQFIGRGDHQVKLRGVRIELEEVDRALRGSPGVCAAAAAVHGNQLVGYVVAATDSVEIDSISVRELLPAHLVPDRIVRLDSLPRLPGGKIDRGALPVPTVEVESYRTPANQAEKAISGVYAQVLGCEPNGVGADASFFAMGGDSLTATRVIARVNEVLGVDLTLRDLFESPSVAGLASRASNRTDIELLPNLPCGPRPERIPLAPAQQRMWILNQIDTASPVYNVAQGIRLRGSIDLVALRMAVYDVLARHEPLRTVYPDTDDGPVQRIEQVDSVDIQLEPVDITGADVLEHVRAVASVGFDVAEEIPVRIRLLRSGDGELVLVLVAHHICGDGSSLRPLTRDLTLAYGERATGSESPLQDLDVTYADYALWMQHVLGSEDDPTSRVSMQLDHWRRVLSPLPPRWRLPSSLPIAVRPSQRSATRPVRIDAAVHRRLAEMATAREVSVFMIVHAALAVLLARLSAGRDITVGTPFGGRGDRRLDDVVGMFVNTLVLRVQVNPSDTFDALLRRVREVDLAAFANADVPFDRVVELVDAPRDGSFTPLFQVMLSFQNTPDPRPTMGETVLAPLDPGSLAARYDVHMTLSESFAPDGRGSGMFGVVTYAADLFDEDSILRFVDQFGRVIEALATEPTVVVGDIALADPPNHLTKDIVGDRTEPETLWSMFDAQVGRTPDATALIHAEGRLTYREFADRVADAARRLTSMGVGPEVPVALAVRRSVDLMVGAYAIVRAGGTYVPVDPDHPADRLADMLDALQPLCVVTSDDDSVPLPSSANVVYIDRLRPWHGDGGGTGDSADPDHAAYVIHTSGSTGRPKGVVVSHRAAVASIRWRQDAYRLGSEDVVLLKTPVTFDASVRELWWPLTTGAAVVVGGPDAHTDPRDIADSIVSHGVTFAHFVPTMLAAVSAAVDGRRFSSLREICCGGEVLPPRTVRDFRALSDATVSNEYGPTETAVSVTRHVVGELDEGPIPIGHTQGKTVTYVLDERLHPCPIGVTGQLYVGGLQLARGYLGRPGDTARRFVADPFRAGQRIYSTGDLVQLRADGALDYVARDDDQVKVRGLRIELGEIESVLTRNPSVAQSAVSVRRTLGGDQLIGYVVPSKDALLDVETVRKDAANLLPPSLVPAVVVVLPTLPRGANGKVDRTALPDPELATSPTAREGSPLEATVARIFGDILGNQNFGVEDDFYVHGGNSLAAVRVVSRLRKELGVRVPLNSMLGRTTPGTIAALVASDSRLDYPSDTDDALAVLLPIRSRGQLAPLFCVHPIVGLSWSFAGLAHHLHPERPIYGLQSPMVSSAYEPASIAQWAQTNVEEIRRIQPHGPYHLLGWSMGGVLAHAMAARLQQEGETVSTLTLLDSFVKSDPDRLHTVSVDDVLGGAGVTLNELPENVLAAIGNGAQHSLRLLDAHVLPVFHGDALYFAASGSDSATRDHGVPAWRTKITGEVRVVVVDTTHWQMTSAAALAQVGPTLADHMAGPRDVPTEKESS